MFLVRAEPFSCFALFVGLLCCLVDPVWHCDHLAGEERVDCLFLFVHSALVCLLFRFLL